MDTSMTDLDWLLVDKTVKYIMTDPSEENVRNMVEKAWIMARDIGVEVVRPSNLDMVKIWDERLKKLYQENIDDITRAQNREYFGEEE